MESIVKKLDAKMKKLLDRGEKVVVSGVPIGFPTLDETLKIAEVYINSGIDIVEFSMPSRDPYIDSKSIADSNVEALDLESDLDKYFETLFKIRNNYPDEPFYMMAYANFIKPYGVENFVKTIKELEIDGLELPDKDESDPEFCQQLLELLEQEDIYRIYIAHDPFNVEHFRKIKDEVKGFLILQAASDEEGKRKIVLPENEKIIKTIKDTGLEPPVILGYGIRDPQRVREAVQYGADGVLIGTAMVDQIRSGDYDQFSAFIKSLKDATR